MYWVGGSGNFSDGAHWAATSGGAGGVGPPSTTDPAIFDSASNATAYTVTVDAASSCLDFTLGAPASGKVSFVDGGGTLDVYGALSMPGGTAGITFTFTGLLVFRATGGPNTIDFNGIAYPGASLIFDDGASVGIGSGSWVLASALSAPSAVTNLKAGSLDLAGFALTCLTLKDNSPGVHFALTPGAAIITCGTFNLGGSTMSSAGTSTVKAQILKRAPGATISFYDFILTSYDGTEGGSISGSWSFLNSFAIDNVTLATVTFGVTSQALSLAMYGTVTMNGTSARLLTLAGTGGATWTMSRLAGASVTASYCSIKDGVANGGPVWSAQHCIDAGNNTGWVFDSADTYAFLLAALRAVNADADLAALVAALRVEVATLTALLLQNSVTTSPALEAQFVRQARIDSAANLLNARSALADGVAGQ